MFGIHDLPLFIASAMLLNITPGADLLYIIGSGARGGRRAGILAALGVNSGCIVHTLFAVAGISALIAASAAAFTIIKYIGVAYLIYLGVSLLLKKDTDTGHAHPGVRHGRGVFWGGFLVNLLNPKISLFFLAFIPQFIHVHSPDKPLAFLALGGLFIFTGTLITIGVVWLVSVAGKRVTPGGRPANILRNILGLLFIGFGARLAISEYQ